LSNGKPKVRDQSSNKFLQRIAGKKALVPPPTPRPIIGEHPVRTLMRENADPADDAGVEKSAAEEPSEQPEAVAVAAPSAEQTPLVPPAEVGVDTADADAAEKVKPPKIATLPAAKKARSEGESVAPGPARVEEQILAIRKKYRLNRGEFSLYRELYLLTHAVGKTECSFVVSELVKSTGMLERRVRDNLRRLKKNGWLMLVEAYDFENREKARYRVNVEPGV
jgi:hypothetical protein